MTTVIPTTEVKNRFGRVLRQVTQSVNPIIIERDGKPVAVLLSITAWQALHPSANLPAPDADLLEAAFGLWQADQILMMRGLPTAVPNGKQLGNGR